MLFFIKKKNSVLNTLCDLNSVVVLLSISTTTALLITTYFSWFSKYYYHNLDYSISASLFLGIFVLVFFTYLVSMSARGLFFLLLTNSTLLYMVNFVRSYFPFNSKIFGVTLAMSYILTEKSNSVLGFYDKIPSIGWVVFGLSIVRVFLYAPLLTFYIFNSRSSIEFIWVKSGVMANPKNNFFFAGEGSGRQIFRETVRQIENAAVRGAQTMEGASGGGKQVGTAVITGTVATVGATFYAEGESQKEKTLDQLNNAAAILKDDKITSHIKDDVRVDLSKSVVNLVTDVENENPIKLGGEIYGRATLNLVFPVDIQPEVIANAKEITTKVLAVTLGVE